MLMKWHAMPLFVYHIVVNSFPSKTHERMQRWGDGCTLKGRMFPSFPKHGAENCKNYISKYTNTTKYAKWRILHPWSRLEVRVRVSFTVGKAEINSLPLHYSELTGLSELFGPKPCRRTELLLLRWTDKRKVDIIPIVGWAGPWGFPSWGVLRMSLPYRRPLLLLLFLLPPAITFTYFISKCHWE